MLTIDAIYRAGQIVPLRPLDCPEGTKLKIEIPDPEQMTEENWPTTPEALREFVERIENTETLQMSDVEYEEMKRILQERKSEDIQIQRNRLDKLAQMLS
jgi:predicted DNA-binding antitoxin AbrB/MazE fold protein